MRPLGSPPASRPAFEAMEARLLLAANPIISEFMADNNTTLANSFNEYADWIEIYNTGTSTADLTGWHLTSKFGENARWTFPAGTTLAAGRALIVWASNRNTVVNTPNGPEIHTNFKLDKDGDYLALVKPDGSTIASDYPIGSGLKGEYYQWTDPADVFNAANLKLTRIDPAVDFTWNGAAPDPGLTGDHVAVRWTGKVKPVYTEATTFTTVSDDGVRLWVDGQLLIDDWTSHAETRDSAPITLNANTTYDIKMEYYQTSGASTARLLWSSARTPEAVIPEARLYDKGGYKYPQQYEDLSFGLGQNISTQTLVDAEDPVYATVPANGNLGTTWTQVGFNTSGWTAGPGSGVGFEANVSGFAVRTYLANFYVNYIFDAENVITTPSLRRDQTVYGENRAVFNYLNNGWGGHFDNSNSPGEYPVLPFTGYAENYVIEGTAIVTIPQAGAYTFGVNSDDGFRLQITGATTTYLYNSNSTLGSNEIRYDGGRGPGDTYGVFSFPTAGQYAVRMVTFQGGGGAEHEIYVAGGDIRMADPGGSFDYTHFHVLGDAAHGGLYVESQLIAGGQGGGVGTFRPLLQTDIQTAMYNHNPSAYVVIPFSVADVTDYNSLTLRMKYDDGFVAYLNGHEIARRNAPTTVAWNSAASAERTKADALTYVDIDASAFMPWLQDGSNVLAIQILNAVATSPSDALVLPQLVDIDILGMGQHYFATASPGAANVSDYWAKVKDTKFQGLDTEVNAQGALIFHDRGFYDTSFHVVLSSQTEADVGGVTIRYTLDGSKPTLTHGTAYTAPVLISQTTVLRAAAFKVGYEPTDVDAQTYVFPAQVIAQTNTDRKSTRLNSSH
jgi:hypothetical protein